MATPTDVEAEAYAFRQLVAHLRGVSDQASNIDVMNASGMCRNCLAKWYQAGTHAVGRGLTMEVAQEAIYGESYATWKKAHQKPATAAQLARFEETKPWCASGIIHEIDLGRRHARHPKVSMEAAPVGTAPPPTAPPPPPAAPPADPCCYDDEDAASLPTTQSAALDKTADVLTVSDRASTGTCVFPPARVHLVGFACESGRDPRYADVSGPAVVEAATVGLGTQLESSRVAVVADDAGAIQAKLKEWADSGECNLVLTTGGTGFGRRDVTPEATSAVLEKLAPGLVDVVHARAFQAGARDAQVDSLLSRAVAGVRGRSIVVNLPGRPGAATSNTKALLPSLLKAIALADAA